jgi:hypothetical protein
VLLGGGSNATIQSGGLSTNAAGNGGSSNGNPGPAGLRSTTYRP